MKIEKIEFQNIALVNGAFDLKGQSVIVLASNGSGKTTFCESFARICSSSMPEDIVSKGADSGSCKIELTDGTIIDWSKSVDEKNPVITLISPEGKRKKNPTQKALQELSGSSYDLNVDFLNKTPQQKKKIIAEMSGLDLTAFEEIIKIAEDNRTFAKRTAKEAEARTEGANKKLAETKPEPITELQERVLELSNIKQKQSSEKELLAGYEKRQKDIDAEFKAMKEKFEALKKENSDLLSRIQKGKAVLANHKDIDNEIESSKEALSLAFDKNNSIEAAKAKQKEVDIFNQKQLDVENAEKAVRESREAKMEAVKKVKLPADLKLDDSGDNLLFKDKNNNWISLEGANEAQKTIIGLKLGLSQLGKVKALAVDLSHLDKSNRQLVFDWANDNDLQLFAEKVSDEGFTVQIVG